MIPEENKFISVSPQMTANKPLYRN